MGPKNEIDLAGCTLYLNGEPVTMGQLPEITLAADAPKPDSVLGGAVMGNDIQTQNAEALALPEPETVYQADDVRRDKPQRCGMAGGLHTGTDAVWGSVEAIRSVQYLDNQSGLSL